MNNNIGGVRYFSSDSIACFKGKEICCWNSLCEIEIK